MASLRDDGLKGRARVGARGTPSRDEIVAAHVIETRRAYSCPAARVLLGLDARYADLIREHRNNRGRRASVVHRPDAGALSPEPRRPRRRSRDDARDVPGREMMHVPN